MTGCAPSYVRINVRESSGCACSCGLGLGACLADDMGLGKTVQVLGLLLRDRRELKKAAKPPSLLVVPASLIGNWQAEIARFAPSLRVRVAHASVAPPEDVKLALSRAAGEIDLGHHQLRRRSAARLARRARLALSDPGRGASHQEPRRAPDARSQGAEGERAHRAHGHTDRKSPRRSVVAVRLSEPRAVGQRQGLQPADEAPRQRVLAVTRRCAS